MRLKSLKIVVFSDSHKDIEQMISVIKKEKPDMIIHLGDHLRDAQKLFLNFPKIRTVYIRGNTDFDEDYISENHIMIEDKLFLITHGHNYNVKWTKKELIKKGTDDNADIILFGHTHEPYIKRIKGMWIMNPGSIGRQYIRKTSNTYGLIYINSNKILCQVKKFRQTEKE